MTKLAEACPFDGDRIAETIFAASELAAAVYNISPILPGHCLVIPRRHVESVLSLTTEELDAVVVLAKSVTPLLLSAFNSTSFDWTLQDGEPAGRTIPHVHLHVIPRVEGDLESPGDWYPALELERQRKWRGSRTGSANRPKSDPADTSAIVQRLRRAAQIEGLFARSAT